MIMATRFIELKKKEMSVEEWDESLADMMEKEKIIFSRRNFSFFPPTVFFKEEIDLAILQEIGILQQLQFSTCFIVCCINRLFFPASTLPLISSLHWQANLDAITLILKG